MRIEFRGSGFGAAVFRGLDSRPGRGDSWNANDQRKWDTAIAIALTKTAQSARDALGQEITKVFDRPVKFTTRAIGYTPASRAQQRSVVFVKRAQQRYLSAQITGGRRDKKPFEQRLRQGVQGAVPGGATNLDPSGNIPKRVLLKFLKQAETRGSGVFVAQPGGHLPPGIYRRAGRKIEPLLIFVATTPSYQKRFDFFGVALASARRAWPTEFDRARRRIF